MTSQLFANVYLNEFDRYVRHCLKPLAYIRYGDDFLVFARSEEQAKSYQLLGIAWLADNLVLCVRNNSDVLFEAKCGAHYLGHRMYRSGAVIDKTMQSKVTKRLNASNIATYAAMKLPQAQRNQLPWTLYTGEPLPSSSTIFLGRRLPPKS